MGRDQPVEALKENLWAKALAGLGELEHKISLTRSRSQEPEVRRQSESPNLQCGVEGFERWKSTIYPCSYRERSTAKIKITISLPRTLRKDQLDKGSRESEPKAESQTFNAAEFRNSYS